MAELALTGLINPALADYSRPASTRADQSTRPESARSSRPQRDTEPRETERVVTGEVVEADDNTYQNINARQTRTGATASSDNLSEAPRRFSMQAAMQTYSDNQALGDNQNRAVQVSGIIDEYV